MDPMIHVGNSTQQVKDSAKEVAEAINIVFTSARENIMDQSTVVEALQSLAKVAEVKNISISNNVFTSNRGVGAPTALPETDGETEATEEDDEEY